jgi:hypothetical protein
MTTEVKTQSQYYDIYKNEVLSQASELTDFSEGSLHDILAGSLSMAMNEISELIISEFSKTYFELAKGPDLEKLAVDHFGESFSRPLSVKSTGVVTFSRPNINSGDVTISEGTIIKTEKDANGQERRFKTTATVIMTGLNASVEVEAVDAGQIGQVSANKIKVIETTLSNPFITVTNSLPTAGGKEAPTDAEYLDIIKAKILALAGATEAAIKGAVLSVSGISMAALVTEERAVIEWDINLNAPKAGSQYFRIPYPRIYIADSEGNSSPALIEEVRKAIIPVRAAGVKIEVSGAVPVTINWTGSLSLNPQGPNYSELEQDLTRIVETMRNYINSVLGIGESFNKAVANAYIMKIWGPEGTDDITSFSSSVPTGNVSVDGNEKLISGNVQLV